jgi:uncharacterized protein (DUF58 family)
MLYPDFNELVGLKDRKSKLIHSSRRSVKSIVPGNHHSPFRGQGLEFDSVREYVFGDDIRCIDWRVTARTGAPHLKLFREDHERHMTICVDMNASMRFGTKNTFKSIQAARVAAYLGWKGLAQHDCISACLFGDVPEGIRLFPPKRTGRAFCQMLKVLAEPFDKEYEISINTALQHITKASHTGSLIYFISDFMELDKEFQHDIGLSRLNQRCDVVFIAINDRADSSISPVGTVKFSSNKSNKMFINTDSVAGREAYTELWKENRSRLYEVSSKLKIPLIELTTESDIHRDLVLGLKSISKRKR